MSCEHEHGTRALGGDSPRSQGLLLSAADDFVASPVHAARLIYEALRLGARARGCAELLTELSDRCDATLVARYADHARAQADGDG
jgi:hypothetical protein